jgi:hypothetical protein
MRGTCIDNGVRRNLPSVFARAALLAAGLLFGAEVPLPAKPSTPPLKRSEIIALANVLASHAWKVSADNLKAACKTGPKYKGKPYHSDYAAGQEVVGIAYDWGGMDDPSAFGARLKKGFAAGSHQWHECNSCGVCTTGMDCSGFVSYVWGQRTTKYSTNSIKALTGALPAGFDKYRDLRPGDTLNKPGSHIVLFDGYDTDGKPFVYEAAGAPVSRVLRQKRSWAGLNGFSPMRYANLVDP